MKYRHRLYIFLLGVMSFTFSQILLRIPLLNFLGTHGSFIKFQMMHPLLYGLLLAFSAGLFEESFRFLFRKFLIKEDSQACLDQQAYIWDAIVFGLGHGLMEVGYILAKILSTQSYISNINYIVIGYERLLAVIFHVCMTIIIWRGFSLGKQRTSLLVAIIHHGLFNSLSLLANYLGGGFELTYLFLTLYCLFIVLYIKKSYSKNWRGK